MRSEAGLWLGIAILGSVYIVSTIASWIGAWRERRRVRRILETVKNP